jgi:hypothetical protein
MVDFVHFCFQLEMQFWANKTSFYFVALKTQVIKNNQCCSRNFCQLDCNIHSGIKQVIYIQHPFIVNVCGHANDFHLWIKCLLSHISVWSALQYTTFESWILCILHWIFRTQKLSYVLFRLFTVPLLSTRLFLFFSKSWQLYPYHVL